MSEISSRRRCAGRWTLAAGAALALPLTATVVYAGQDTPVPPTPAVAPIAPIAPQAPVAPKSVKHVVIVHDDANHADGHGAAAFERRVERDGKTIVVRSERELSEADFEAKLAELETRLATLDPIGGPDGIAFADGEGKRKFVFRRQFAPGKQGEGEHELLMRHFGPGEAPAMHAMMLDASQCAKGEEASAEAEADADGQRQVVRIKLCGASAHRGEALKAIREARSEIAGDKELSEAIRAKVLEQLDRSIERMEKEAR